MSVDIRPLTSEAFSPFGDVISAEQCEHTFSINYGLTTRFHDLARIDTLAQEGKTSVNIFRSTPMPLPIRIELLERHPLSSQLFYPLSDRPYLVVVAPQGPLFESNIRCFIARGDQGVNYARGTWHHFSLALEDVSDFLVVDRTGPGDNCDEQSLETPLLFTQEAIEAALR